MSGNYYQGDKKWSNNYSPNGSEDNGGYFRRYSNSGGPYDNSRNYHNQYNHSGYRKYTKEEEEMWNKQWELPKKKYKVYEVKEDVDFQIDVKEFKEFIANGRKKDLVKMRQNVHKQTQNIIRKKKYKSNGIVYDLEDQSRLGTGILAYSAKNTRLYTQKSNKGFRNKPFSKKIPSIDRIVLTKKDFLDVAIEENRYFREKYMKRKKGEIPTMTSARVALVMGVHPCAEGGEDYDDGIEEECYRRTSIFNSTVDPNSFSAGSREWPYQVAEYGGVYIPQCLILRKSESEGYAFYSTFEECNFICIPSVRKLRVEKIDVKDRSYKRYNGFDISAFYDLQLTEKFRKKMEEKFRSIFSIAKKEKEEVLIFAGPYGCHKAPPFEIALIARTVIEAEFPLSFRKVVFCIKENPNTKYGRNGIFKPFSYCFTALRELISLPDQIGDYDPNILTNWNSKKEKNTTDGKDWDDPTQGWGNGKVENIEKYEEKDEKYEETRRVSKLDLERKKKNEEKDFDDELQGKVHELGVKSGLRPYLAKRYLIKTWNKFGSLDVKKALEEHRREVVERESLQIIDLMKRGFSRKVSILALRKTQYGERSSHVKRAVLFAQERQKVDYDEEYSNDDFFGASTPTQKVINSGKSGKKAQRGLEKRQLSSNLLLERKKQSPVRLTQKVVNSSKFLKKAQHVARDLEKRPNRHVEKDFEGKKQSRISSLLKKEISNNETTKIENPIHALAQARYAIETWMNNCYDRRKTRDRQMLKSLMEFSARISVKLKNSFQNQI